MNILFCGGGTGGHIYPGLALARYILKRDKDAKVLFVGTSKGLENKIIPAEGFNLEVIPVRAFSKSSAGQLPAITADLFRSTRLAFKIIKQFQPDIIIGTGGYAAGPVVLAARLLCLPILIHEQNAIPGRTNRMLAPWANRVCISFEDSGKYFKSSKVKLTGNPRAGEVIHITREEGFKRLGLLDPEKKTILVFGGSQGALKINDVMVDFISGKSLPSETQLFYITGNTYYERVIKELKKGGNLSRVIIKPYLDDMPAALAVADLVICRAGATALAEITARGVPAILIPSPNVAYNHQYYNALLLEKEGAAKIITENNFDTETLAVHVKELFDEPGILEKMAVNSKTMGITDAAERMYDCISEARRKKEEAN